jgi:hypothetical protein
LILIKNNPMTNSTLTLCLSSDVSARLLPDIEALVAPADINVFLNALCTPSQTRVECSQTQHVCSLLTAAIMTWLRLCVTRGMHIWRGAEQINLHELSAQKLFTLLMEPQAQLRLTLDETT